MMRSVYLLVFLLCAAAGLGQPKGAYDKKREITYDGKRYSVFNNYLTIGGGTEYNTYVQNTQLNLGGDYNFHITNIYFQTGFFLAGNSFGNWNHLQLHGAIGKRFELKKFNMAGYLGGSFSSINRPLFDSTLNDYVSRTLKPLGLHATVQFTYKFKYDVGIGIALFSDINKAQSVYGVRLELYFSSAFRGYRRAGENEDSILNED
jgi:hypothetical protein